MVSLVFVKLFIRPDGRMYEGGWMRGVQHGVGWFKKGMDSKMRKGIWDRGIRVEWLS